MTPGSIFSALVGKYMPPHPIFLTFILRLNLGPQACKASSLLMELSPHCLTPLVRQDFYHLKHLIPHLYYSHTVVQTQPLLGHAHHSTEQLETFSHLQVTPSIPSSPASLFSPCRQEHMSICWHILCDLPWLGSYVIHVVVFSWFIYNVVSQCVLTAEQLMCESLMYYIMPCTKRDVWLLFLFVVF